MSTFIPFTAPNTLNDFVLAEWEAQLVANVNLENLGWDESNSSDEKTIFHNAHQLTTALVKRYVDHVVVNLTNHYNSALTEAYNRIALLSTQLVAAQAQVQRCQSEVDRLPVHMNEGVGKTRVPEPPTFAGSENKMHLQDWLNQMALFCSASGINNSHQKIICALTRLRAPASTYMKAYFDKVQEDSDLGSWDDFVEELKNIYGQRDDKEGAKKELTQLWNNKDLAKKNFIKYVERYRTLARIVNYTDEVHIDKLKDVIPDELRTALIMYEITQQVPKGWDDYLKLLMNAYKALHPEKAQGTIFGNNTSGSGNKDPDAMEIDQAKKKKEKEVNSQEKSKKYCQICAGKGFKSKAKTHNTADCYDKPGNEGKRPQKTASSSSSSSKPSSSTGSSNNWKGKSLKMRLLEAINSIDDDDSETPSETIDINHATIEEILDSMPVARKAIAQNDDELNGSPGSTGPKLKGRAQMDFPKGL